MRTVTLIVFGAALLANATLANAQNGAWYNPYVKGVKAVENARYAEAVALLERAVAADPRAARNKYIEGVFRTDYIPYFYLAIAYSKLGRLDKAAANATKAAEVVPPDIVGRLTELRRELNTSATVDAVPAAATAPGPAISSAARAASPRTT